MWVLDEFLLSLKSHFNRLFFCFSFLALAENGKKRTYTRSIHRLSKRACKSRITTL